MSNVTIEFLKDSVQKAYNNGFKDGMETSMHYYLVKVKGYSNDWVDFIVKTDSKKKAIDLTYKQVVSEYSPDYMRSRLYEPYHKKDITALRVDKLMFNEDGITDLYPID